jgi:hypothetical protein
MKTTTKIGIILILLVTMLVTSCSLGSTAQPTTPPQPSQVDTVAPIPSDTPLPTDTATPTVPPPTSTPAPTSTPSGQYATEFDDPSELYDWKIFRVDSNSQRVVEGIPDKVTVEIDQGKLHVEIKKMWIWMYFAFETLTSSDVKLETEVTNLGRNTNNISLLCRYSDAGWYEFNIGNDGLYNILRYDAGEQAYYGLASGGTTSINMGKGTNQYTVICEGDQLTLYINGGKPIKSVTDDTFTSGNVGLSASAFDVLPIILDFDWMKVSVP